MAVISYVLAPKQKSNQGSIQDFESPTADAGRPIPVVFGSINVKGLNILGYWDKQTVTGEK